MKVKKLLAVLFILGVIALSLAACSNNANYNQQSDSASTPASAEAASTAQTQGFPIVKEPLNLTYWVTLHPNVAATLKNYNEIVAYKETEKRTGIHIDFQHPATGQETDQLNLLLSSGKLPDFIETNWFYVPGGPTKALKDGTIIRLNDYIDKYAPNLKKLLDEKPIYRKLISTDNGDIYVFPFLRDSELPSAGIAVRKDWIDKLNLKIPVTVQDWYQVLKAFKEKDPNGNGKPDEIPFMLDDTSIDLFAGAYGVSTGFYQENGNVKYGPIQPEFKTFLSQMNQWYKEGLIDQEYVAANSKIKDGYMVNNQLGAMYMSAGSGVGRYKTLVSETIPGFTLAGVSFPVLKPGEKTHFGKKSSLFQGTGTAITKNNKNIVESVKWLDYKFGTEGHLLFNFGKEGTSYVMENGYPKLTSEVMKNPKGLAITQAIAQYALSGFSGPFIQDSRYTDQYYELPEQLEAQKIWGDGDNDKTIFGITFTPEEAQKIASIQNDITTYQKEMINKFIMGTEPINRFDEFVKTIKQMGIDTYAGYEQEALERYNKR